MLLWLTYVHKTWLGLSRVKLLLVFLWNNEYKLIFFLYQCRLWGSGCEERWHGRCCGSTWYSGQVVCSCCSFVFFFGSWILQLYICNTCKHGSWYEGLRELLCEGLVGDCCLSCCRGSRCWWNPSLRTQLRVVQPWVAYYVVYCDILTVSIISPQLLCFRGTITSSMSSRAIQSNLNRSLNASVCVFGA